MEYDNPQYTYYIYIGDDIVQAMTRAAQQLLRFFYLLLDWGLIQRAAIDVALRKMKCTKLNVKWNADMWSATDMKCSTPPQL